MKINLVNVYVVKATMMMDKIVYASNALNFGIYNFKLFFHKYSMLL